MIQQRIGQIVAESRIRREFRQDWLLPMRTISRRDSLGLLARLLFRLGGNPLTSGPEQPEAEQSRHTQGACQAETRHSPRSRVVPCYYAGGCASPRGFYNKIRRPCP